MSHPFIISTDSKPLLSPEQAGPCDIPSLHRLPASHQHAEGAESASHQGEWGYGWRTCPWGCWEWKGMGWGQGRNDRQCEGFPQLGQTWSSQRRVHGLHVETLWHTAVPSCFQLFAG